METNLGHIASFSFVMPRADEVPAAHKLPPDQPILCYNITDGAKFGFGDPKIQPTLLVVPIAPYCPFCWAPLIEELPEIAHLREHGSDANL
jgi:hypothetical protein